MEDQEQRWFSGLPEDYGEGQRQFDMASAALSAAEPWIWTASSMAGCALSLYAHSIFGMVAAFPIYWFSIRPLKRGKAAASLAWQKERESWDAYINRPWPPRP